MLDPGRMRTAWIGTAAAFVVFGIVFTATHVTLTNFDAELGFRKHYHSALEAIIDNPTVRSAVRRCGPVSTPNHKLIPDVRWLAKLSSSQVIARGDPRQAQRIRSGVAIYVVGRYALLRQALVTDADNPLRSGADARVRSHRDKPLLQRLRAMRRRLSKPPFGVAGCAALLPLVGSCSDVLLRLWGMRSGLPYAFNADENAHFVPRAIGLFGHGWNPALLRQPARIHVPAAHRLRGLVRRPRGRLARLRDRSGQRLRRRSRRVGAARNVRRRPALPRRVAAVRPRASACSRPALLGVSFLPVFYSHLALNDVPTLAPVALALWAPRASCARAAAATTCSPVSGSGSQPRRSTRAGSSRCRCSRATVVAVRGARAAAAGDPRR